MYLHLGQDTLVRTSEVIGIFDMTSSKRRTGCSPETSLITRHSASFKVRAQLRCCGLRQGKGRKPGVSQSDLILYLKKAHRLH